LHVARNTYYSLKAFKFHKITFFIPFFYVVAYSGIFLRYKLIKSTLSYHKGSRDKNRTPENNKRKQKRYSNIAELKFELNSFFISYS